MRSRRQVYDFAGNPNVASYVLDRTYTGYGVLDGGLRVAGAFVPFGGTVCLTPYDLERFSADCPQVVCGEGGCRTSTCPYERFNFEYTELNDGLAVVRVDAPIARFDSLCPCRRASHDVSATARWRARARAAGTPTRCCTTAH
jgi:hypothetical protein